MLRQMASAFFLISLGTYGQLVFAQTNDTGGVPPAASAPAASAPAAAAPAAAAPTSPAITGSFSNNVSKTCKEMGAKKQLKGDELAAFLKKCKAGQVSK